MPLSVLKRLVSILLSAVLILAAVPVSRASAAGEIPFTDVPKNAWYYNSVSLAYQKGLVAGTSKTSFSPNGTLTIIEAVTLAARMHQMVHDGKVTLRSDPFVWYESYANYADTNGLIYTSEYWDDRFEPITRAQFVKIFYNVMDSYDSKNTVEAGAIPDVPSSDKYSKQIYAFYRSGILTGSDAKGTFRPQSSIMRCEVAAIMSRMFQPELRLSITLLNPNGPEKEPDSVLLPSVGDFSGVPGLDAPVTEDNVFAILDACDPDGAYLMRETALRGDNILVWWGGTSAITDRLDTAVHEQCHGFTHYNGGWNREAIYLGNEKYIVVTETDVFNSLEMAGSIPEDLRTFRYSYVGTPETNLASQVSGPYGLLGELTAYCWGTHVGVCLYDYYVAKAETADQWVGYVQLLSSEYCAYTEFKYFILQYLLYAKENDPAVYSGIVNNTEFRAAYSAIDDRFAAGVDAVFLRLEQLEKHLRSEGHTVFRRDGYFFIDGCGAGIHMDDYELLSAELEKPAYQEMNAVLHR